jgi:hypothetical protein
MPRSASHATLAGEPGDAESPKQSLTTRPIDGTLRDNVLIVTESGNHCGLDGCGRHQADVLSDAQNLVDQVTATGNESGPIAGKVRLLAQRVDRENVIARPVKNCGVENRRGR